MAVRYSAKIADEILRRLETGETLHAICRDPEMPAFSSVMEWTYEGGPTGFADRYARARLIGYNAMAEDVLAIADDGRNDWIEREQGKSANTEHIQRSRLRFDARRWLLSKALPKIYGDKLELGGPDGGPIQVSVVKFTDGDADK